MRLTLPRTLVHRAFSAYTGFNMERDLRTRVVPVLQAHEVRLAYLFGSHAKGEATELSDVDLAVSFDVGVDVRKVHGELLDDLVRELETDRIDLVVLEEIPPPLAFRIIRDGERLVARDPGEDVSFRTRTIMRYLDFKPLRDAAFRSGREAILAPE
jgi:predicted nucleotidyltransferase